MFLHVLAEPRKLLFIHSTSIRQETSGTILRAESTTMNKVH